MNSPETRLAKFISKPREVRRAILRRWDRMLCSRILRGIEGKPVSYDELRLEQLAINKFNKSGEEI